MENILQCKLLVDVLNTKASRWTIFVRLALVGVFIPEGIQKLIYPEILGTGRFIKMGIPFPEFTGPFVGWLEIICGLLILIGLFTRFASIPLIITMLVAIIATKFPIWMGHDWMLTADIIFYVRELKSYGFWPFMHEIRLDWTMLMGACYLLAVGGGQWSLDKSIVWRNNKPYN